jgi:peroxiredoxin
MLLVAILTAVVTLSVSPAAAQDAPAADVPRVLLTKHHAALCIVRVGDAMPPVRLSDTDGKAFVLPERLGAKATVVVFFRSQGWMTKALLADLEPGVVKAYGAKGVSVAAVSQGAYSGDNHSYPILIDEQGAATAQVGTGRFPRVYVLDAQGKIVWFDIEYSRSTRRELKQTLSVLTGAGN